MSTVTDVHAERETLAVDINIPGHEARTTTALFARTKKALLERDGARCFICGATEASSGHPLESHHHPVERSLANMIDWQRFAADARAGRFGPHAQAFDWDGFMADAKPMTLNLLPHGDEPAGTVEVLIPADPMRFVDDQTVNGIALCKAHHTGKDEGIHCLPYPLWIAQKYAREGYQFSDVEIIHHEG